MMISLVAAIGQNYVLGKDGKLPWQLPGDMAWIKQLTMGKPIIMGRKTHDSIGKVLPGRLNIVISRHPRLNRENLVWVTSIPDALKAARDQTAFDNTETIVFGGGEIYSQTIKMANRLYLTEVAASPPGDAFFPAFDRSKWMKQIVHEHPAENGQPAFVIKQYDLL